MIDRFRLFLQSNLIVFNMFLWHIAKKFGMSKKILIAFTCLFCVSILSPIAMSYLFFESEIDILHTIATYVLFLIWSITIIIFVNPKLLNKLEYNCKYSYHLGILLNRSYMAFLEAYKKYCCLKSVNEIKATSNNYDLTVINVIYMEIFKMYFTNINKNLNTKKFLFINTKILIDLENDHQINDFYGRIFFDSNDTNNTMQNFNKVKIYIIDKVIDVLNDKSWFNNYYKNTDIFELINHVVRIWWSNIIKYSQIPNNSLEQKNLITN